MSLSRTTDGSAYCRIARRGLRGEGPPAGAHHSFNDLGRRLARERGAGVAEDRVVELADSDAVQAALGSGAIDATVTSVADLFMSLKKDPELQAGMPLGEPGSSAWGLRKQDAALRAAIDDYLRAFRQGPSWSRLVVIYFGDDALAVLGRANVK